MSFEFATAGRIVFGPGVFQQAGKLISESGKHALVVYGVQNESLDTLFNSLSEHGVEFTAIPVNSEPAVEDIQRGIEYREYTCLRHGHFAGRGQRPGYWKGHCRFAYQSRRYL